MSRTIIFAALLTMLFGFSQQPAVRGDETLTVQPAVVTSNGPVVAQPVRYGGRFVYRGHYGPYGPNGYYGPGYYRPYYGGYYSSGPGFYGTYGYYGPTSGYGYSYPAYGAYYPNYGYTYTNPGSVYYW